MKSLTDSIYKHQLFFHSSWKFNVHVFLWDKPKGSITVRLFTDM